MKKGYMEMIENFYLETWKSVLGSSILHYSLTIRIGKHIININQDGFNPCNAIIFQKLNIVSSEEDVENSIQ